MPRGFTFGTIKAPLELSPEDLSRVVRYPPGACADDRTTGVPRDMANKRSGDTLKELAAARLSGQRVNKRAGWTQGITLTNKDRPKPKPRSRAKLTP